MLRIWFSFLAPASLFPWEILIWSNQETWFKHSVNYWIIRLICQHVLCKYLQPASSLKILNLSSPKTRVPYLSLSAQHKGSGLMEYCLFMKCRSTWPIRISTVFGNYSVKNSWEIEMNQSWKYFYGIFL